MRPRSTGSSSGEAAGTRCWLACEPSVSRGAKMARASRDPTPRAQGEFTMTSPDGALSVHVTVRREGIAVERTVTRAGGRRVTQTVGFAEESNVVRWCHSDDLWFTYPLLFSQLTRRGCELFNTGA